MFKDYLIYANEKNEEILKNESFLILKQIIGAYNACNSPGKFNEFISTVIGILEDNFDYGY